MLILNKLDLNLDPTWHSVKEVPFSCLQESRWEDLRNAIYKKIAKDMPSLQTDFVAINQRHKNCFKKALHSLEQALDHLKRKKPAEFIALEIRLALDFLGEVVGKVDTEDLLGEIFSSFCIGK